MRWRIPWGGILDRRRVAVERGENPAPRRRGDHGRRLHAHARAGAARGSAPRPRLGELARRHRPIRGAACTAADFRFK